MLEFTDKANCVTLEEVKRYIRIDDDFSDHYLNVLIETGHNVIADRTGQLPFNCEVAFTFDSWYGLTREEIANGESVTSIMGHGRGLILPYSRAEAVEITYLDENEALQTLEPENYTLNTINGVSAIVFRSDADLPTLASIPQPIGVLATYSDSAPEHHSFKLLVMAFCGQWYRSREPFDIRQQFQVPLQFEYLANSIRRGDYFA